jgi:peptide/nickel transport system substrate-binding protein
VLRSRRALPRGPITARYRAFAICLRHVILLPIVLTLVIACAGPRPAQDQASSGGGDQSGRPSAPKRLTVGIFEIPFALNSVVNATFPGITGGSVRGIRYVEPMVSSMLTMPDGQGVLQAHLAESVPSLENGLWRLLPDGRMETTWRLRDGVRWHDGTPVTSADLLLSTQVFNDSALPEIRRAIWRYVDGAEARDERSITIRWKQLYNGADGLFGTAAVPLPQHLLGQAYQDDKTSLLQHPYWSTEFVGTGPFKLRTWQGHNFLILDANPAYHSGKPRIDEIEVRFIVDGNAMLASVLAGEVEATMGFGIISVDQALMVKDQWREGRAAIGLIQVYSTYPQFVNPIPPILANVELRRALLHAIDREAMAEALVGGLAPIADTIINPNHPAYREIEPSIVKYPYDARRATQLVEGLGYARGSDGMYRDSAGEPLVIEQRTTEADIHLKYLYTIGDYWKQIGVTQESVVISRQIGPAAAREYRATRGGFELTRYPTNLDQFLSSEAPLPANGFSGNNRSRYMNAELDGLIERYYATVPMAQRNQLLASIVQHMTNNLTLLGIHHATQVDLLTNRLSNVLPVNSEDGRLTWNVQEWDLR